MVRGRRLVKVISAPWVQLAQALARRADNLIGKHWLPQTFTSFLFARADLPFHFARIRRRSQDRD